MVHIFICQFIAASKKNHIYCKYTSTERTTNPFTPWGTASLESAAVSLPLCVLLCLPLPFSRASPLLLLLQHMPPRCFKFKYVKIYLCHTDQNTTPNQVYICPKKKKSPTVMVVVQYKFGKCPSSFFFFPFLSLY